MNARAERKTAAVAVVLAAGVSRRMAGRDKIFAPLGGRPLIYWSLALYERCADVDAVVAVTAAGVEETVRRLAAEYGLGKIRAVVAGGERRQDSARAGIAAAAALAPPDAPLLLHDAARPLAGEALVRRVVAALAHADGVVPAVPLADTVKRVDDEGYAVVATLARERLRAVQTPQAFRRARLAAAYERAEAEGWEVTDDAAVMEKHGGRVVVVAGDINNFKVTFPEDLERAEALVSRLIRPGAAL